jgi:hypothetical protein
MAEAFLLQCVELTVLGKDQKMRALSLVAPMVPLPERIRKGRTSEQKFNEDKPADQQHEKNNGEYIEIPIDEILDRPAEFIDQGRDEKETG